MCWASERAEAVFLSTDHKYAICGTRNAQEIHNARATGPYPLLASIDTRANLCDHDICPNMNGRIKMKNGNEDVVMAGHAIAPGLAIGKAFVYTDILRRDHELYDIEKHEVVNEHGRIELAIKEVIDDLGLSAERIEEELEKDLADIFHAQKAILQDPSLLADIRKELEEELVNSEQVVKRVFRRLERKFREIEDETISQRADDIADIGRRLLRELSGIQAHVLEDMPENSVLVAMRLLPSDTVFLSRRSIKAVVVESGGTASHAALLTRELGIPAVAEIPGLLQRICQDDLLLVDGFAGKVAVNPDAETEERFRSQMQSQYNLRAKQQEGCHEPATTLDGVTVQVMANVGCREDVKLAAENGADGIGLYRLEQFYLSRKNPPSEEELIEEITHALQPLGGKPVTLRLLDVGGDKNIPFIETPFEADPFLGRRGIRLLLEYPELTKTQLRAIMQSRKENEIAIMAPMITLTGEMKQLRDLLAAAAKDVCVGSLPALGAMIETPAAALCSDEIGQYSDFVSIGTNDLTQYTMVAGRENPLVSSYFIDDHPAILKMVHIITQGLGAKPVAVCGELAANLDAIPALLKEGIRCLSVPPPLVPVVKDAIRHMRLAGPDVAS